MNTTMPKVNLYEKYCKDKEHATDVKKYALMIFEALYQNAEEYKNLSSKSVQYLEQAALLHDIGYAVEKKSHHKHTMNIIINEGIDGFSREDAAIIANIARYHRGSLPDINKHEIFAQLPQQDRELVTKLGAILRLADGLDKPHKNLILRMQAKETEDTLELGLKTIGFKPNLKMAEEKKDLLEFTLQKQVKFVFI